MNRTSAWPLSALWALLIVYASLYPFSDWRVQGVAPWAFVLAPWPKYWTGFDLAANILGYLPLGFLLALGVLRGGNGKGPIIKATLATASLSLALEALQTLLPARVPSNLDWLANSLGGLVGAVLAVAVQHLGLLALWSRVRERWFESDSRGALVLLALWPVALLFPMAITFGVGQIAERFETVLVGWLADTPFLEWLPMRDVERQPLSLSMQVWCVALGACTPMLLAFGAIGSRRRRLASVLLVMGVGIGMTVLSAALSWGPQHGLAAFGTTARRGCLLALVLILPCVFCSRRLCSALGLIVVVTQLSILNQSHEGAYLALTLQTWEQGRFVRFNGIAQWIGWLWPYVCIAYWVASIAGGQSQTARGGASSKPRMRGL